MLSPTGRGQGIGLAVIDSGAAATHPDLVNWLAEGRDRASKDWLGWVTRGGG